MSSALIILAVSAALFIAALAIFALLVAGIRQGKHSCLTDDPRGKADVFARRILIGSRHHVDQESK